MPTKTPTTIAAPPIKNILKLLRNKLVLEIFAEIIPRKNNAKRERIIESQTANSEGRIIYGKRGINPERK
mgnify:CR=1 FL=1